MKRLTLIITGAIVLTAGMVGPAESRAPITSTIEFKGINTPAPAFRPAERGFTPARAFGSTTHQDPGCVKGRTVLIRFIEEAVERRRGHAYYVGDTIATGKTGRKGNWKAAFNTQYPRDGTYRAILKVRRLGNGNGMCTRATDDYEFLGISG